MFLGVDVDIGRNGSCYGVFSYFLFFLGEKEEFVGVEI